MKLRVIAVTVGNEIKKIPNDTLHLFVFFSKGDLHLVLKYGRCRINLYDILA